MTQPEHTPGPWYMEHTCNLPIEKQSCTIWANLPTGSNWNPDNDLICELKNGYNANLIATAPELLEALESAVNFYVSKVTTWRMGEACANGFPLPENIDWPPYVVKAHSAIVKVRGSQ